MIKVEAPPQCWWIITGDRSLSMPLLPKCGSTTLRGYPDVSVISVKQVLDIEKRVAWIRHPIKRLHSVWQESHMRNPDNSFRWMLAHTTDPNEIPTWEGFVDMVLSGASNVHWNPQVPQITYKGTYLPTITERFENFAERIKAYLNGRLPRANKSNPLPADLSYRRRELESKYKEDLDLWESIN